MRELLGQAQATVQEEAWLDAVEEARNEWLRRTPTDHDPAGRNLPGRHAAGQQHPVVVVSREELNRGKDVVAAVITSAQFTVRSGLANCVPLQAGQFGMTKDCVIQGETAGPLR